MKKKDIKRYEGKRLKILLKNNFFYTCNIEEVMQDCIRIKDKFGNSILISLEDISMVTVIGEWKK